MATPDEPMWNDRVCSEIGRASRMDFWDRYDGPWGEDANSFYRLGGRALARDDDPELWLMRAVDRQHPGGYFRMALVYLRRDAGASKALGYLRAAKFADHGDARNLLAAWTACINCEIQGEEAEAVFLDAVAEAEDPAFAAEVAVLLARLL